MLIELIGLLVSSLRSLVSVRLRKQQRYSPWCQRAAKYVTRCCQVQTNAQVQAAPLATARHRRLII
jgi:hypothetical protein